MKFTIEERVKEDNTTISRLVSDISSLQHFKDLDNKIHFKDSEPLRLLIRHTTIQRNK